MVEKNREREAADREAPLLVFYGRSSELGGCVIHPQSQKAESHVLVVDPRGGNMMRYCSICEHYILAKLLNAYYRRKTGRDSYPIGAEGPIMKDEDLVNADVPAAV